MPFHILPVGDADISELISIQNAAFASNPIDNAMFPTRSSDAVEAGSGPVSNVEIEDATAQKDGNAELIKEKSKEEDTSSTTEHQIAQLRKDMTTNEASRYIKCVDEDGQKIISWAKWEIYPSSRPETEWMKDTELEVEPGANKEYTEAFVRGLDDWKKKLFRGDPYCCE
ncbi:MAG: hypothetical protein M1823_000096 [Watsoniomyces obsoletus]|nr:MAG: hypothetical protein M1823_000096 [Watsoniomyces obsoletus]